MTKTARKPATEFEPVIDLQTVHDAFLKAIDDLANQGKVLREKSLQFDNHLVDTQERFDSKMGEWRNHIGTTFDSLHENQREVKASTKKEMSEAIETAIAVLNERQESEFNKFSRITVDTWRRQINQEAESTHEYVKSRFQKLDHQNESEIKKHIQALQEKVHQQRKELGTRIADQQTKVTSRLDGLKSIFKGQIAEIEELVHSALQNQQVNVQSLIEEGRQQVTERIESLTSVIKIRSEKWFDSTQKDAEKLLQGVGEHNKRLEKLSKQYEKELGGQVDATRVSIDTLLSKTETELAGLTVKVEGMQEQIDDSIEIIGEIAIDTEIKRSEIIGKYAETQKASELEWQQRLQDILDSTRQEYESLLENYAERQDKLIAAKDATAEEQHNRHEEQHQNLEKQSQSVVEVAQKDMADLQNELRREQEQMIDKSSGAVEQLKERIEVFFNSLDERGREVEVKWKETEEKHREQLEILVHQGEAQIKVVAKAAELKFSEDRALQTNRNDETISTFTAVSEKAQNEVLDKQKVRFAKLVEDLGQHQEVLSMEYTTAKELLETELEKAQKVMTTKTTEFMKRTSSEVEAEVKEQVNASLGGIKPQWRKLIEQNKIMSQKLATFGQKQTGVSQQIRKLMEMDRKKSVQLESQKENNRRMKRTLWLSALPGLLALLYLLTQIIKQGSPF